MMSWMLRRALGEVAAGGGAARIMSPLPSAPRPPGPHSMVRTGEVREGFPPQQRPLGTFLRMASGQSLTYWRCGPWIAGEWRTSPRPPARMLVCARVCDGGGALSAPSVLKHRFHQSQNLVDGALLSLLPREDGSPLTHPNQEVLKTSAPPKALQCSHPYSPLVLLP